ncbi:MAG: hypothetical protein U5N86_12265 [Planctomycetota bacterium]|nr:hypothetical protein [Planctomycetota bacterium]
MFVSIEVATRQSLPDFLGDKVGKELQAKGLCSLNSVRTSVRYHVQDISSDGDESAHELAHQLGRRLLTDPVSQVFAVDDTPLKLSDEFRILEVARRPGVMDPVEQSVRKAVDDLGFTCANVRTSTRYDLCGVAPLQGSRIRRTLDCQRYHRADYSRRNWRMDRGGHLSLRVLAHPCTDNTGRRRRVDAHFQLRHAVAQHPRDAHNKGLLRQDRA